MEDAKKIESLEQQVAAMRSRIAKSELTNALALAGTRKEMLDDALTLLSSKARIAFGDDGELTTIELDGEQYDSATDAAKAFLSSRKSWTAEAAQTQPESTSNQSAPQPQAVSLISSALAPAQPKSQPKQRANLPKDVLECSPADLIQAGLDEPA